MPRSIADIPLNERPVAAHLAQDARREAWWREDLREYWRQRVRWERARVTPYPSVPPPRPIDELTRRRIEDAAQLVWMAMDRDFNRANSYLVLRSGFRRKERRHLTDADIWGRSDLTISRRQTVHRGRQETLIQIHQEPAMPNPQRPFRLMFHPPSLAGGGVTAR